MNDERPYWKPKRFELYPYLSTEDRRSLQVTLTCEPESDEWSRIFAAYRRGRKFRLVFMLVGVLASIGLWLAIPEVSSQTWKISLSTLPAVLMIGFVMRTHFSPRFRFFRLMAKAERMASANHNFHHRYVQCLKYSGRAARMLFLEFQRSRRSWLSPPTVADSAMECAAQLIDIQVSKSDENTKGEVLKQYGRFLRDVSFLVVVRREDLIPVLRQKYAHIRRRYRHDGGLIPEADARFLDPTRNMNRWEVRKEFYYPLATWFSAIAALVALVVSLTR